MTASTNSTRPHSGISIDPKLRKHALTAVYLTVFIDVLGFGIILPSMPFFAQTYGANGFLIGVLMSAYSTAQFISAPLLGRLSDRVGRRPVILVSLMGTGAAYLLMGFANGLTFLFVGRALAGAFAGNISSAQAYVADVTTRDERSKFMGLLGASIGMGFVFGPAIGAAFASRGFGFVCFIAAGLALFNFALAWVRLPESRKPGVHGRAAGHAFSLGTFRHMIGRPRVGRLLIVGFCLMLAFIGMEATLALYTASRFEFTAKDLGITLTLCGVLMAIIQGGLIGRITKKLGDRRTAMAGMLTASVGLLLLPVFPTVAGMLGSLLILCSGQALSGPTISALLSKEAHADEQGGVLGMSQSLGALARVISPLVAGALYDISSSYPYWAAGAVAMIGLGIMSGFAKPSRT